MLELSTDVAQAATNGEKEEFTMVQIENKDIDGPVMAAQTSST